MRIAWKHAAWFALVALPVTPWVDFFRPFDIYGYAPLIYWLIIQALLWTAYLLMEWLYMPGDSAMRAARVVLPLLGAAALVGFSSMKVPVDGAGAKLLLTLEGMVAEPVTGLALAGIPWWPPAVAVSALIVFFLVGRGRGAASASRLALAAVFIIRFALWLPGATPSTSRGAKAAGCASLPDKTLVILSKEKINELTGGNGGVPVAAAVDETRGYALVSIRNIKNGPAMLARVRLVEPFITDVAPAAPDKVRTEHPASCDRIAIDTERGKIISILATPVRNSVIFYDYDDNQIYHNRTIHLRARPLDLAFDPDTRKLSIIYGPLSDTGGHVYELNNYSRVGEPGSPAGMDWTAARLAAACRKPAPDPALDALRKKLGARIFSSATTSDGGYLACTPCGVISINPD